MEINLKLTTIYKKGEGGGCTIFSNQWIDPIHKKLIRYIIEQFL